jgi:hypothetical protein
MLPKHVRSVSFLSRRVLADKYRRAFAGETFIGRCLRLQDGFDAQARFGLRANGLQSIPSFLSL